MLEVAVEVAVKGKWHRVWSEELDVVLEKVTVYPARKGDQVLILLDVDTGAAGLSQLETRVRWATLPR